MTNRSGSLLLELDLISLQAAISSGGRYVVFTSYPQANFALPHQIYWKDLESGSLQPVTINSEGVEADEDSQHLSVSTDGRYVLFRSFATNLVPDDTNDTWDIFLQDMMTGEMTRVSTDSAGIASDTVSDSPSMTSDAELIVFSCAADYLAPDDDNDTWDIFLKERLTGTTTLVSRKADGTPGNGPSYGPKISENKRYVAFGSLADNLVEGDANGAEDVFRKDLLTGEVLLVSEDGAGNPLSGASTLNAISDDGRYVVIYMWEDYLAGGQSSIQQCLLKDLVTGELTPLSTDSDGMFGNGGSRWAALSADVSYKLSVFSF